MEKLEHEIEILAKEIHKNATNKGFHAFAKKMIKDCKSEDSKKKMALMNLSQHIALITTELSEACESLRKDIYANTKAYMGKDKNVQLTDPTKDFEAFMKDTVEDELSDTFIRLLDTWELLRDYYRILRPRADLLPFDYYIQKKMDYNKTRPKLHKSKF